MCDKRKVVSPRFSFEGWDWKLWMKGYLDLIIKNWDNLVELGKWGLPIFLGLQFFQDNPAMIAPVVAIGKAVLDIIHYWLIEKKV